MNEPSLPPPLTFINQVASKRLGSGHSPVSISAVAAVTPGLLSRFRPQMNAPLRFH